jgi:hypothetical protein
VFYGSVLILLGFECAYFRYAKRASALAERVQPLLGRLHPGLATRDDVEMTFRDTGVVLNEEPCSGDACRGLFFGVYNYPRFEFAESVSTDLILAQLSLARPTTMTVDFYFEANRLQLMRVEYKRKGSIRIFRYLSDEPGDTTSMWIADENGKISRIQVSVPESGSSPDDHLTDSLDFTCMASILHCSDPLQLWPGAPAASSPQSQ